jgi:hypothetical protein
MCSARPKTYYSSKEVDGIWPQSSPLASPRYSSILFDGSATLTRYPTPKWLIS